jgi:hypothetical protein
MTLSPNSGKAPSLFVVREGAVHPRSRHELTVEYEATTERPELFTSLNAALVRAQERLVDDHEEAPVIWIVSGDVTHDRGSLGFVEVKRLSVSKGNEDRESEPAPQPSGAGLAIRGDASCAPDRSMRAKEARDARCGQARSRGQGSRQDAQAPPRPSDDRARGSRRQAAH